ncbi:hypothetical protein BKA69DRAFT_1083941 [Paraphysoderma sedebokerense]|nr:hypothetical protein BKA69DRAFT_1083941 [Paraphysoderma sedebokerense]
MRPGTKKVFVYRNGDRHYLGRKVLVTGKRFKNWEQFLHSLTADLQLNTGAVRKLYTVEGIKVNALAELNHLNHYVGTSGEAFKPIKYPIEVNSKDPSNHGTEQENRNVKRGWGIKVPLLIQTGKSEEEKPIFTAASKGYRVAVFANGDDKTTAHRLVLSWRNCRTFEQLLNELTSIVRLKEGRVRKIFDAKSFKRIKFLAQLYDGQNIICSGTTENVKRVDYQLVDLINRDEVMKNAMMSNEVTKVITVYPNGDAYHTGINISVTKFRFKDLRRLLGFIEKEIPLYTGKPDRLYTIAGKRIGTLDELQHNEQYVAVAGTDPFQNIKYNVGKYVRSRTSTNEATGSIPGSPIVLDGRSKKQKTGIAKSFGYQPRMHVMSPRNESFTADSEDNEMDIPTQPFTPPPVNRSSSSSRLDDASNHIQEFTTKTTKATKSLSIAKKAERDLETSTDIRANQPKSVLAEPSSPKTMKEAKGEIEVQANADIGVSIPQESTRISTPITEDAPASLKNKSSINLNSKDPKSPKLSSSNLRAGENKNDSPHNLIHSPVKENLRMVSDLEGDSDIGAMMWNVNESKSKGNLGDLPIAGQNSETEYVKKIEGEDENEF